VPEPERRSKVVAVIALAVAVGLWIYWSSREGVVSAFPVALIGCTAALIISFLAATYVVEDVGESTRGSIVVVWFLASLVGPPLGWLVGSDVLVALGPSDWWPRYAARVLVGGALPFVAMVGILARLRRRSAVTVMVVLSLTGVATLSAARSARDLVRGAIEHEVRPTAVEFRRGGFVVDLGDRALQLDPHRFDVHEGERGRASYLTSTWVLLDWRRLERREPETRTPRAGAVGEGFGYHGSIVALAVLEAVFVLAAILATLRARRMRARVRGYLTILALVAMLAPLLCFPRFLLLATFGNEVEATVVDRLSGSASYRGRTTYWYAVRARSGEQPLADEVSRPTYDLLRPGDRVRFVVLRGVPTVHALGEPQIGLEWLIVLIVAIVLALPSTLLVGSVTPRAHP